MSEESDRQKVVDEALTWVGTPYVSNGDVKGAGVDCGMLLVRVFVDTGLVPMFDPRPYAEQWGLNGDREMYKEIVERFCQPVQRWEDGREPLPGDIVLFKIDKVRETAPYCHGTLVTKWPNIVHSVSGFPVCCDKLPESSWMTREHLYYSFWPQVP